MAYLSNLPYDVEDQEISDFFKNLKVKVDLELSHSGGFYCV